MSEEKLKLGGREYDVTPGLREAYAEVAGIIKAHGGQPPESVVTALEQLDKMDLGKALATPKQRRPGK